MKADTSAGSGAAGRVAGCEGWVCGTGTGTGATGCGVTGCSTGSVSVFGCIVEGCCCGIVVTGVRPRGVAGCDVDEGCGARVVVTVTVVVTGGCSAVCVCDRVSTAGFTGEESSCRPVAVAGGVAAVPPDA